MADAPHNVWSFVSSLAWPAAAAAVVFAFRKTLAEMLENLNWRVRSGAGLKIGGIEIGGINVTTHSAADLKPRGITVSTDSGERFRLRGKLYSEARNIFLVHQIAHSTTRGQLYDILIYVIAHKTPALSTLMEVRYYFGAHWGDRIFTSTNRQNGFAVATSAYGPFLCTAELIFNDDTSQMISRYIDFEMGASARVTKVAEGKSSDSHSEKSS